MKQAEKMRQAEMIVSERLVYNKPSRKMSESRRERNNNRVIAVIVERE